MSALDTEGKAAQAVRIAIEKIDGARREGKAFPYSTAIPIAHYSVEQDQEVRDIMRRELGRRYGVPIVSVTVAGAGWLRIEVRE